MTIGPAHRQEFSAPGTGAGDAAWAPGRLWRKEVRNQPGRRGRMRRRHCYRMVPLVAVVIVMVTGVCLSIHHRRPLVPTTAWEARCASGSGASVNARVYQMLFRPQVLFIEVPATETACRHRWFVVDTERKVIAAGGPGRFPYLYYNQDRELGIQLGDAKLEEEWRVVWSHGGVRATTGGFELRIRQPQRP